MLDHLCGCVFPNTILRGVANNTSASAFLYGGRLSRPPLRLSQVSMNYSIAYYMPVATR